MIAPFLGSRNTILEGAESNFREGTATALTGDRLDKPMYTGRYLMIFKNKNVDYKTAEKTFENNLGAKVASSNDFINEAFSEEKIDDANVYIYNELGIALVAASGDEINQVQSSMNGDVIIEPELVVYTIPTFAGLQANAFSGNITWGVDITKVNKSAYTGKDIPVAVLDTGLDFTHPDFIGRTIVSQSFVPGVLTAQDGAGHGTHCIGTACGYVNNLGNRYGIAHNSHIYVGKVLDDTGRGAQSWIINGIDWAAKMGCKVISMSLGSKVFPGMGFSLAYEASAANAVSKGAIVVAAAGNDSSRSMGVFNPVGSPANCPSIIAVGAAGKINPAGNNIISNLQVADFSNRTINLGQEVDITGPGVQIYSSWPLPAKYKAISGTSMATPHVAGILALLWEQYPIYTPVQIAAEMRNLAQILPFPAMDAGAGLVTAP